MAALPRHQDGGSPVFVATVLLLALLLVLSASRCSASCELCYDTGNCSSAVGPGIPGFFCSVTLSNSSNASSPVLSYTCCGLTQACTATPSVPIAYCASSPPSSSGAPAAPTTSSSPSASDVMSEVFIGLSLLLAGFLLLMTLFMGAALLWMAAAAWRRRLREGRRLKSVMPVEGEEEQRERQRREQTEREQRQQEEERREEARQKEQRRRNEQAQLQAVLERARAAAGEEAKEAEGRGSRAGGGGAAAAGGGSG